MKFCSMRMSFYFICFKYPVSEAVKKVRVWLIPGSDKKAKETDVLMPLLKNMETLIFWIKAHEKDMGLAT